MSNWSESQTYKQFEHSFQLEIKPAEVRRGTKTLIISTERDHSQFMSMAMLVRTGLVWLLLFPRHSRRESMSSLDSCSSFMVFLLLPGEISSQLVSSTFPSLHQLTLELGQPGTTLLNQGPDSWISNFIPLLGTEQLSVSRLCPVSVFPGSPLAPLRH